MSETTAYKVFTADQWLRAQNLGLFSGSPADIADGYIHLSTLRQLRGTLDKHYTGLSGLVLAQVDLARVGATVRWEKSRDDADFPHIYGGLPLAAITRFWSLALDRHGHHELPAELG